MSFLNKLLGPPGNIKRLIKQVKTSANKPGYLLDPIISELKEIGEPAVQPLCDVLMDKQTSFPVRNIAAIALMAIGKPSIEPLMVVLQKGNEEARSVASAALRSIAKKNSG